MHKYVALTIKILVLKFTPSVILLERFFIVSQMYCKTVFCKHKPDIINQVDRTTTFEVYLYTQFEVFSKNPWAAMQVGVC